MIQNCPFLLYALIAACIALAAPSMAEDTGILAGYTLSRGPITLAGVADDFSGITYDPVSDTLYGIQNDPTRIVALNKDLQVERKIDLVGFDDTEDICHVDGQRFAVVEERRRFLCEFTMTPDDTEIAYKDADRVLVEPKEFANKGIEGVAYNAATKTFVLVKEKKPRRIYSTSRDALTADEPEITHPWDIAEKSHGLDDLSSVTFDPKSGHLLVLSDDSQSIIEVSLTGEKVGELSLTAGSAGLKAGVPQPEGICLGKNGTLYIASEPNLVFEFKRP